VRDRDFLDVARHDATGATEAYWRGAVIHAYYALFLECRDALVRWGRPPQPRQNVHAQVRLCLAYAHNPELQRIADSLDVVVRGRDKASYDLTSSQFHSVSVALNAIWRATDALALLDAIDADPARRAAAIASLPP
jgi:hypothetical protein